MLVVVAALEPTLELVLGGPERAGELRQAAAAEQHESDEGRTDFEQVFHRWGRHGGYCLGAERRNNAGTLACARRGWRGVPRPRGGERVPAR